MILEIEKKEDDSDEKAGIVSEMPPTYNYLLWAIESIKRERDLVSYNILVKGLVLSSPYLEIVERVKTLIEDGEIKLRMVERQ